MLNRCPWVLLAVLGVTGCAGSVIFGHTIGEQRAGPAPSGARWQLDAPHAEAMNTGRTVGLVTIAIAPQARKSIAADPRFKENGLLAAVEGELRARHLFDDGEARGKRSVEISIDDFTEGTSINSVMFGYNLGAGALAAHIAVRNADDGTDMGDFRIEAHSRFASRVGEPDSDPLGSLYRRFAVLTVDHLTGTASRPVAPEAGVPR